MRASDWAVRRALRGRVLKMTSRSVVGIAGVVMTLPALAKADSAHFEIPAEALPAALKAFAAQSHMQLMYQYNAVSTVKGNAVSGDLDKHEALQQLLKNTGLEVIYSSDSVATIRPLHARTTDDASPPETPARSSFRADQRAADPPVDQPGQGGPSAAGVLAPNSSAASENTPKLEEVIVTAEKKAEPLQKAPLSIAAITGSQLERRNAYNLDDFLAEVPGVSFYDAGAGHNSIAIRGVDGGPLVSGLGTDPATALYLGETVLTTAGVFDAANLRTVDIDHVEVLRGPQGTLFGASSLAGAVRYIPNAPNLTQLGGSLDASYANDVRSGENGGNAIGVFNLPLVDSKLALRVATYYFDEPGYIKFVGNQVPSRVALAAPFGAAPQSGGNGGGEVDQGVRVTLLWRPIQNFSALATYLHQNSNESGLGRENIKLSSYEDYPLSFGGITPSGRERDFQTTDVYNLTLNLDLEKVSVVSSSSYTNLRGGEDRDISLYIPYTIGAVTTAPAHVFSQEIRASSKLDGPINALVGAYYGSENATWREQIAWLGSPSLCCGGFGTDPNNIDHVTNFEITDQSALFGELYYQITGQLKLTLGGRYFDYSRKQNQTAVGFLASSPTPIEKVDKGGTIGKANLSYSFTDNNLVYAQFSQGFRLGEAPSPPLPADVCDLNHDGIVEGTNVPLQPPPVQPDTVDSWEIGSKNTWLGGRLRTNSTIYYMRWKNIPGSILPKCGFQIIESGPQASSRGIEMEADYRLTSALRLNLGLSAIDARLDSDAQVLNAKKGDRLVNSSPFQVSVGGEYGFKAFGRPAYARMDYGYIAGYYFTYDKSSPEVGNFGKLDSSVGVDLGQLEVSIFGKNLTGSKGLTAASDNVNAYPLRPTEAGVRLKYVF